MEKITITYALMIIGTLALTGFPFLSGFYSKDAIIEFAYLKGNTTGYYAAGIGIITAFLTSIYSWRLIFKTFHGDYNNSWNDYCLLCSNSGLSPNRYKKNNCLFYM